MAIYDIISEILLYVNILGGLIVGTKNIVLAIRNRGQYRIWMKWGYAFLGFYWAVVYSILKFVPMYNMEYAFTKTWIRPSISLLITLIVIESMTDMKPIYLPAVIKSFIQKIKSNRRANANS
jgi:hypothetical protein